MKEDNTNSNKFTQVRTGYARAAMLLMAVNLFMTGYVVTRLADYNSPEQEPAQTKEVPVATTSDNKS
tara:strand:+ start:279 stop:479 length:201 start_codon:yes stop_codon:yes gene_type:complete